MSTVVETIRDAIAVELARQSEETGARFTPSTDRGVAFLDGAVDLDALARAVNGALVRLRDATR